MHAWRKSYTAVLRSLHAFDLIRSGCSDSVWRVSTATSISSDEITECTLAGSRGFASCGGLGRLIVCFFTAFVCALVRFRFAISGNECNLESISSSRCFDRLIVIRKVWWDREIDAHCPRSIANGGECRISEVRALSGEPYRNIRIHHDGGSTLHKKTTISMLLIYLNRCVFFSPCRQLVMTKCCRPPPQ